MPHFGEPIREPSLVPIPTPSFPQPSFPTTGGFFGDFTDPFGGAGRGPGLGPLGSPEFGFVPQPIPLPPPTDRELLVSLTGAERDAFIQSLVDSANASLGTPPPRPSPVPFPLPLDLLPIPGATPGADLIPMRLLGDTFVPVEPVPPVAARPTSPEEREASAQAQQLASDILRFLLQLFGPSPGTPGATGAGVVGSPVAVAPSLFPSPVGGGATGGPMPNVSTSFLGGLGELLTQGVGIGLDVLGGFLRPEPTPGFAPPLIPSVARPIPTPMPVSLATALPTLIRTLPALAGGIAGGAAVEGGLELLAEVAASNAGGTCIVPTRGAPTARLPQRVDVPVRDSGGNVRFVTYKNMGRAILFSGDFAAAKRVKKVAGRARRSVGGR